MNFNKEQIKQLCWLIVFSLLLLSSQFLYLQHGFSAVGIILLIATIFSAITLLGFHQKSKNQIVQVINALANNDPTLGLARSDPLSKKLAQLRDQIQHSRLDAEVQAQYLQALLIHLDISILVVDDEDNILHKNPASERLLGHLTNNISSLDKLGELISQTKTSQRATISFQQNEHANDTLSVHISCCEIQGKSLKVVSIQSIYQALIAKEQQAYKQLTRVLTHEVANSITPLASLAHTAVDLLPDELVFNDSEDKEDLNIPDIFYGLYQNIIAISLFNHEAHIFCNSFEASALNIFDFSVILFCASIIANFALGIERVVLIISPSILLSSLLIRMSSTFD